MNIKEVSKREVLDFKEFKNKVHDENFKPLEPKNQKDSTDKTGLSKIKREPAYDFVGYADAVFGKKSGIEIPGYNEGGNREYTIHNASPSIVAQPGTAVTEGMEFEGIPKILKISDFEKNPEISEETTIEKESEEASIEEESENFNGIITKISDFK